MPEQQALGAEEFVDLDVIAERPELLEHLPRDGFRADVFISHPGVFFRPGVEGVVDEIPARLRMFQLLQLGHPVVVLHALRLEFGDFLALQSVELRAQDGVGLFKDRLDEREQVERVFRRCRIEQRNGVEEVKREDLVERKILGAGRR
jgi:hypothetical protein